MRGFRRQLLKFPVALWLGVRHASSFLRVSGEQHPRAYNFRWVHNTRRKMFGTAYFSQGYGLPPRSCRLSVRGAMLAAMNAFVSEDFDPVPSLQHETAVLVTDAPAASGALALLVPAEGDLPKTVTVTRDELTRAGFAGKRGETYLVAGERLVALVGIGSGLTTAAQVRDAAATAARATRSDSKLVLDVRGAVDGIDPAALGAAVVEGATLARYRYDSFKTGRSVQETGSTSGQSATPQLDALEIVIDPRANRDEVIRGAERGTVFSRVTRFARDLGNTPPRHLTAPAYADLLAKVGPEFGLDVEVYDKARIVELGLGGLLGVNAGSAQEPRVIKLSYRPESPTGHLGLVGKGIMYDSGGISLKPSDPSHCSMKMDMMGSGAVASSMLALQALGVTTRVTGWLMCTDNMPSSRATKLGDVLTMRNGKTVEVRNTDAEGRLVLGDGLALAAEETPRPDALIDIATLTGAALLALGEHSTALFANNDAFADQVRAAAATTAEDVWRMPLDFRLKKQLKSNVADFSNIGERAGGAITAALYLTEFVDGLPWAHLDIAPTMEAKSDELWHTAGSTGVGARLLAEIALNFEAPQGAIDTGDDS